MSRKFTRRRTAAGTTLVHELLGYAAVTAMLGLFALQATMNLDEGKARVQKRADVVYGYGYSSSAQTCGNDTVEGDEVCDGGNFNGATCQTYAFDSGFLTCTNNCTTVNTSFCENSSSASSAYCGNAICDGTDTPENCSIDCGLPSSSSEAASSEPASSVASSEQASSPPASSEPASSEPASSEASSPVASSEPASSEQNSSDPCGNGSIDPGEACDGTNFGDGQDGMCATYDPINYDSGGLSCTMDCASVDVSACGQASSEASSPAASSEPASSEASSPEASSEPASSEPASSEPESSPAASSEPASSEPASSEPASSEPESSPAASSEASSPEASSEQASSPAASSEESSPEASSAESSAETEMSTFSTSLPIDPPTGCRYSIDARVYWPEGSTADLDLYLANDTDDVVIHYDDTSGGGLQMNRNAHPNCALSPVSPEIIAGSYLDGVNRDFRAWYAQFSTCEDATSADEAYVVVRNMGAATINVNETNVGYGQTHRVNIVKSGYDTGNAAAFLGGTRVDVKCGAFTGRCGNGIVEESNNEQCELPGTGTCDANCHIQTGGGGGGGTPPPPPPAASSSRPSSRSSSVASSSRASSRSSSALAGWCCQEGQTWQQMSNVAACGGIVAFQQPTQLQCDMPANPSCNECSLCGRTALSLCTRSTCEGIGNGSCTFTPSGPLQWFGVGACAPNPGVCSNQP